MYDGAVYTDTHFGPDHWSVPAGTQLTTSEGHPWNRNKRSGGDIGGDFYTTKSEIKIAATPQTCHEFIDEGRNSYESTLHATLLPVDPSAVAFPPDIRSSNDTLDEKGATAVARCQPTNSIADLSTFLGETLKDGLPSIPIIKDWERKAELGVKAGSEFLNVVFGWQPMISDIRKTADAIRHAEIVTRQFLRDRGKSVRRGYVFPTEITSDTVKIASNVSPWQGPAVYLSQTTGLWDIYLTTKKVRRVWFKGAFTYGLPKGFIPTGTSLDSSILAKKLLGLDLTPQVLWELTPWSWAIDWVTNTQDVLSNISAAREFGLVMQYGYVMEHTITENIYTAKLVSKRPTVTSTPSVGTVTVSRETKVRRRANPFGFGLTNDGLSDLQKSILVALGLSHRG